MKSRWIGLVFVVIVSMLFAIRQYHPGTWLMGWDSLHPEFNYELAFSRVISGTWRESQGVGTVAVHSHMSELPRIATLWVINLFVPNSAVRWAYILLMLFLGVVGAYVLFVHILSRMRGKLGMGWVVLVAIVGSLVYLFNLSTLHHFLVPFEMFVVLFGLLPWSLWSVSRYLQVSTKVRLAIFLVIQFLISSCAFAATLWVVYFSVLVLTTWFLTKHKKHWIKVISLTLMVNSYWLMPTMYGLLTMARVVESAKINQVFSPEAWLNNAAYGTVPQVLRLESFILQWMNYDRVKHVFDLVVSQWTSGANQYYVRLVLNVVVGMMGLGLLRWIYLILKGTRETRRWSGLVFAGLLLFLIMLSQVWPITMVISWARENLPLVGEILRTPFTKVSIFLQLIYALLISIGLVWAVEKVRFGLIRIIVVLTAVVVIVFPFAQWIFKGNLIGDVVVTKMPKEYTKLFEATKKMGDGRMVAMPLVNMWGWEYRDWGNNEGYEGANFTQFGILQPLLIRDFDRWSPYNEAFYNQFSTALYGGDKGDVERVLTQYDVKYVFLDESVIAPGQGKEILRIEETKQMAEEMGWERVFNEGFLSVYEIPIGSDLPAAESAGWALPLRSDPGEQGAEMQGISAPGSYTWVDADTSKVREDVVYGEVGHYVSAVTKSNSDTVPHLVYPFAGLMREEIKNVEYEDRITTLRSDPPDGEAGLIGMWADDNPPLQIPGWKVGDIVRINYHGGDPMPVYYVNGEAGPRFLGKEKPEEGNNYIVARVSEGKEWVEYLRNQEFGIRNQEIVIEVPGEPQIYDFGKDGKGKIDNCDVLKRGSAQKQGTRYVADERGAACDYVEMKELDTRLSYLMRLQGENKEGRSLKYFLYNTGNKRNDIEWLMGKDKFDQTFSVLPWAWDGYYSLNIETRSFGQRAENVINPIEVRWLPLEQIARARIVPIRSDLPADESAGWDQPLRSDLRITELRKTGTWLYRVKVEGSGLLKLSQGYDEGWLALDLEHVKVDGWANGWIVPRSGVATIFYCPQLLEYLGFGVLGLTTILFLTKENNDDNMIV